jgi:hypothetical protein
MSGTQMMPSMDSEESGELPEEPRGDQKYNKQKIGADQSTAEADSEDENEKGQPMEHSELPSSGVVLATSQVHAEPGNSNELHRVCLVAGPTSSRWDADDDEEAEEKPVKSRWGDDDKEENATIDEDAIPENATEDVLVARNDPANVEEENKTAEADDPGAEPNDAKDQNQETSNTRRSKRNMLFGCRSTDDFEHLRVIGQGAYGEVSKCGLASVNVPGFLLQKIAHQETSQFMHECAEQYHLRRSRARSNAVTRCVICLLRVKSRSAYTH